MGTTPRPRPDAIVVAHSLGGLTAALVASRLRAFVAVLLPVEDVYARALDPGFHGSVRDELGRSGWPDAPWHLDAGHFGILTHARELTGLLDEAA